MIFVEMLKMHEVDCEREVTQSVCVGPGVSEQVTAFGGPSLAWAWVFAIGVLAISSLGIYAGCSENALALKIVRTT